MLFNSLNFLVFFPIVVAAYFFIPQRFRWILLLIASYYFYMSWNYKYIILIVLSTVVDYFAGLYLPKIKNESKKKGLLFLSLFTNLGLLFSFKYFNFFSENINYFFDKLSIQYSIPNFDILLPVGISFYTFQTLSYTIDVYKGKKEPEKHFGKFALYVSFFPQLVAGPIERSERLLPQFHRKVYFNYERIKNGLLLMVWGFFKKVVIADRIAEYVDIVYTKPESFDSLQNFLATIFFSFQIYCDFSGYSDIAIGTALILGYDLMINFKRPYLARNIRDFWKRWHISLSTWFRDYLYIPLGGNRVVKWRWYFNLFMTFLISGLWHGANWTFVVWGALHGIYQVIGILSDKYRMGIKQSFGITRHKYLHSFIETSTTIFLAWFAWIFFRANHVGDAFVVIQKIFSFNYLSEAVNLFQFKIDFVLSLFLIGILFVVELFEEHYSIGERIRASRSGFKWGLLILVLLAIMIIGKWEESNFLYFQF